MRAYYWVMSKLAEGAEARPLRSDAVRNRDAILKAASVAFATHGERVDVREIARSAGVGMGTLYRHFPTKEELLETVLHTHFAEWTHTARIAAARRDPAEALSAFLRDALERQAQHRALVERFAATWDSTAGVAACRRELHPVIDDLVTRCHDAGVLRPDVTGDDISLLMIALGRIAQFATEGDGDEIWRRPLHVVLNGLLTVPSPSPPPSPAGPGDQGDPRAGLPA